MAPGRDGTGVSVKVKAAILEQIDAGRWRQGDKLPSERELCRLHQVSRVSVRRAIAELVISGQLETIPGKGTFVKKCSPMRQRTGTIAVVRCMHPGRPSSVTGDVFYPAVFAGIEAEAALRDVHCIVVSLREDRPDWGRLEQLTDKVDGLICGEVREEETVRRITSGGLPVVLVSPSVDAPGVDVVEVDNVGGASMGVRHLIELGHRHIAFVGGPPGSLPSRERGLGYRRALEEAGIPLRDSLELYPGWRLEDGYHAVRELLQKPGRPPTAIFAASDLLALGAFQAAQEAGLRVGVDLSVLGFDDVQLAQESRPALTTVRVGKSEIGETAARLLFERIDGKRDYPLRVVVPTTLIVRDSTGPADLSKASAV